MGPPVAAADHGAAPAPRADRLNAPAAALMAAMAARKPRRLRDGRLRGDMASPPAGLRRAVARARPSPPAWQRRERPPSAGGSRTVVLSADATCRQGSAEAIFGRVALLHGVSVEST